MSDSTAVARLAFHGFGESETPAPTCTPAPSPTRAAVDAAVSGNSSGAPGPEQTHRVHGAFRLGPRCEIRVTTQRSSRISDGKRVPARLVVRPWLQMENGRWWPAKGEPGIVILESNVVAFGRAVARAARHLLRGKS